MNVPPILHRNSSISCDDSNEVWQITETTPMRDFWKNLLTPWRQCGWVEQQHQQENIMKRTRSKQQAAHAGSQNGGDSPTTSSDDESDPSMVEQQTQSYERPPLAKQRGSSIHYVPTTSNPYHRRHSHDMLSCNSSTKSRHKREMALQEYPEYIDRIMIAVDHNTGELTEDDDDDDDDDDDVDDLTTDEDDDFFELSSSSNDEYEPVVSTDEAWKYEWANDVTSTTAAPPQSLSQQPKVPMYLPQTPVPHAADPNPIFIVGWAAVELFDEDERSLYFCQLIRDESLLAIQLCDDSGVRHVIPYQENLRIEYRRNLYGLNVGNALKIIPMPIVEPRRLSRDVSAGAQHESILFLQFGLDAAARSVDR